MKRFFRSGMALMSAAALLQPSFDPAMRSAFLAALAVMLSRADETGEGTVSRAIRELQGEFHQQLGISRAGQVGQRSEPRNSGAPLTSFPPLDHGCIHANCEALPKSHSNNLIGLEGPFVAPETGR